VIARAASEFRLPWRFIAIEALSLPPFIWMQIVWADTFWKALSAWLLYFVPSQLVVILYFRFRTRPIVKPQSDDNEMGNRTVKTVTVHFAEEIRKIESPKVRFLLANIVRVFLEVARIGAETSLAFDPTIFESSFPKLWSAARRLSEYEVFLSGRSVNEIKERQRRAELRIKSAKDSKDAEKWIQEKVQAESEYQRFVEIREAYSRVYLSLINFLTLLRKVEWEAPAERDSLTAELSEITKNWEIAEEPARRQKAA
jgi:hypothetical protein